MKRFEGKVAVVTGAASGIGKATALRLGEEGASLMLGDMNEEGLRATADAISKKGSKVVTQRLDVCEVDACKAIVEGAVAEFGKLDVLCNIAGIAGAEHFEKVTDEFWNRIIAVNLSSVFFLSRTAIPHLLETKGNIVNMASTAGLVGQIYNAGYCASKAGVVMLTKSMAIEFAGRGVRVNAVCPGAIRTALSENFKMPENVDMSLFSRLFPLMEAGEADEVATAVAYLASDEARFVTGAAFAIDGGQTAG